jgi:cell filamentation protein, protein adenylyltransferase
MLDARNAGPSPGRSDRAGTFRRVTEGGETYFVFHPRPLPPVPDLEIDGAMQDLLDTANQALGRLDGSTFLLPDPDQFLYSYIRKEAVLSSQIEGTQSSLSDLLLFEHDVTPGVPIEDVRETSNYIAAMTHGLERMKGGFPLSLRLIREVHALLLRQGRGTERSPGEFRRSQNWIGGTRPGNARYVPPPHLEVIPAMGALEKFLHNDPVQTPILVKAALAHAQFETIHPFLDGNGRVGRLLVTLLLCEDERVLSRPLLYLSLYLKEHRDEYYRHLTAIRTDGEWEPWLQFFLEGVVSVARSATETTKRILTLVQEDRARVMGLGKASASAARLHDLVTRQVVFTISDAAKAIGVSEVTLGKATAHLEQLGVVTEITGRARNRVFVYDRYLRALQDEDPVPLA